MSGTARVKISGVDEFVQALRDMDAGLPKMQRTVLGEVLGEVIDYARPRIPNKTGRARASLKSRVTDKGGSIALGGPKAPWAPWLDFGGQGKRRGRPSHREFLREGRYVYKALAVRQRDIHDIMAAGVDALARTSGLEVT